MERHPPRAVIRSGLREWQNTGNIPFLGHFFSFSSDQKMSKEMKMRSVIPLNLNKGIQCSSQTNQNVNPSCIQYTGLWKNVIRSSTHILYTRIKFEDNGEWGILLTIFS